ncbi:hypothetical protein HX890_10285 [Pseudomonas gingeri]|uniref:hypothetical protein n=1 Tax=Pseudomonas gingeri TaxID=117681 RepID=UPI0015A05A3E|nr:hypothetical protein [Pseudomonas gingeri]NWD74495.1 hypothetical protein [Pseudomonas gingeri]
MKKITSLLLGLLACLPLAAWAGWYEVRNYTGTFGDHPVHVSLQTYVSLQQDKLGKVDGSYYYDKHLIPIALHGKQQTENQLTLCEEPDNQCPITLTVTEQGASGIWSDGKRALPISLQQVGRLDNTDDSKQLFEGIVEIPMWSHTKNRMFLGVYGIEGAEDQNQSPYITMKAIKEIEIKTGRLVRTLDVDDQAGLLMTPIYMNVEAAVQSKGLSLMIQHSDGHMGYDENRDIKD